MYFLKTPTLVKSFYNEFVWDIPTTEKIIYLTFDDGPMPGITEWVLKILKEYNAQATFFCVGDNVRKYPEIFQSVLDAGHVVGNHTYGHLNGWKTNTNVYIENVRQAGNLIESNLFRPPYGKLKPSQSKQISKDYKIIMWDVLSGDFDKAMTYTDCVKNLKKNTKSGSIVVFHDSIKSELILRQVLAEILEYWTYEGYEFRSLGHLNSKKQEAFTT